MGNRGQLHDAETRSLVKQTWTTNTWIICVCDFKDRQRALMSPGSYTELFFLDEVTGLAAGHRPCYECRRSSAVQFAEAIQLHLGSASRPRAQEISKLILPDIKPHIRTLSPEARKRINPHTLPDGAIFAANENAYLKIGKTAHKWSFLGYLDCEPLPKTGIRLTPKISCAALENGYKPHIHESAFS